MSVIQFLTSGGLANIGGDLIDSDRELANNIARSFGAKIKNYAISLQVPASLLKVNQCTYLFIARDIAHFHFVFAEVTGGNTIIYRDFSLNGRLELQSVAHQIRIEIGDVIWAFSCHLSITESDLDKYIQGIAQQYVTTVLESQRKPDKKISEEAVTMPEIASGLERFRMDYPLGSKTAFIIMRFGDTKQHQAIATCIKNTLKKHSIIALRADDKQYMDDLFNNIKTYMHACDFGIAVFDRITGDDFNPNVSLEVGYMFGMGRDVLLLKDNTLKSLHTDLTGKIYKPFDTSDVENSIPIQIEKWLSDKGILKQ